MSGISRSQPETPTLFTALPDTTAARPQVQRIALIVFRHPSAASAAELIATQALSHWGKLGWEVGFPLFHGYASKAHSYPV
jgi:hypothetical protein